MPDSPTDLQPINDQRSSAQTPAPRKRLATRLVLLLGGAALVAGAVVYGIGWWTHGRFVQGTDDAYLQADVVAVAPKIQGYVEQVFVTDNQEVAAGQPLVRIDQSPYQASLAQNVAGAGAQRAAIAAAESQIAQQTAAVAQAQAQLEGAQASLAYARAEDERFRKLSAQGAETRERAAQAHNNFSQALATQRADAAALDAARRNVDTLKAQLGQSQAKLAGAEAQVHSAQLNLDDTLIRAGIAGRIGDRTVQIGQFVQAGTRLMSIVPTSAIYLVANFKETQLTRMRVGQPARVSIDALGGRTIDAVVESFAPGTGATFALLPPQNATGNFTKIVQRVPVRLRLDVPADLRARLIAGLSATADVDTDAPN